MARANRHFIPGQIWHITHRCHKKDFLLKLVKDRLGWMKWLYEAKSRHGLTVFNFITTSNHVHLLVLDEAGQDAIPKSMQLIAGRTAQEYNRRKNRKGAFWEDRYHATAIEGAEYLLRCLVYIDLNMVRAGVVSHPSEWPYSGYREIQSPRRKCAIIAYEKLAEKAGFQSYEGFRKADEEWVNGTLPDSKNSRQSEWTESIAVGSETFTRWIQEKLGIRAKGRTIIENTTDVYQLRELEATYIDDFDPKKTHIGAQNTYYWDAYSVISGT
jgi:putative transposase